MAPNLLPIKAIPLYAAAEALLYVKLQAGRNNSNPDFLRWFMLLIGVNFLVWLVFWGYIHAYYISPLKRFPITKATAREGMIDRTKMDRPPGSNFLSWMATTPNDGIIRTPFPMVNNVLLTSPGAIADVLVHQSYNFEKPKAARDVLRTVLGDGLIIVEGDVHKFQRKHLLPSFGFRHIKQLYPVMWTKSLALMDIIAEELAGQPADGDEKAVGRIEIGAWASKATLDIIGVAGIGSDFGALKNADHQLTKDYEELLAPDGKRIFHFFLSILLGWGVASRVPMQTNYDLQRLTTSLHSQSSRIVREKRAAVEAGGDHLDILGLLIKSNDFSDAELTDQVLTFLAAGHETTSSAFTWATYLLSLHPEIRTQLRDEIRNALPTDYRLLPEDTNQLADTLEKLPLLNGVCQETLRLYPTVPITVRAANNATQIQGMPIPAGTHVVICPWAINRAPHLWGADAADFRPQRWISDDGAGPRANNHGGSASNYNLLTFLHGPRSCIGQGFAKAELRCLIAAMVLNFDWELAMEQKDVVPAGVITIKPKKGMYLKMRKLPEAQ